VSVSVPKQRREAGAKFWEMRTHGGYQRQKLQRFRYTFLLLLGILAYATSAPEQADEEPTAGASTEVSHGFGAAKHFMPLPHTVVGAHCTWQLRLNTVPARIPETITEVICHSAGERCGGSMYYSCKQMKSKMLVAHTEPVLVEDSYDWRVRAVRNITVNIGCSCVYRAPVLLDQFVPGPQEKKRAFSRARPRPGQGGWEIRKKRESEDQGDSSFGDFLATAAPLSMDSTASNVEKKISGELHQTKTEETSMESVD